MDIVEIKGDDYSVRYDPTTAIIKFLGELSLGGPAEYAPIVKLLNSVADQDPSTITLDLRNLEFLNSSGISTISKFVINLRKKRTIQLIVLGSNDIPWQGKSLKNLQRLLPSLKLEIE
ncbi:MAG: STAS domain-containing protein [Cyanophyceae cyanobacterium]